jgi:hypothetical protein
MSTRYRTAVLTVLRSLVVAGCLGPVAEPPLSQTPTTTWVQGTTPTDESPLLPTNATLEQFPTGVGVCEHSRAPVRTSLSQSASTPDYDVHRG